MRWPKEKTKRWRSIFACSLRGTSLVDEDVRDTKERNQNPNGDGSR